MFTTDDKVLIFDKGVDKGWGARKTMSEFPGRNWKQRKVGSGRSGNKLETNVCE